MSMSTSRAEGEARPGVLGRAWLVETSARGRKGGRHTGGAEPGWCPYAACCWLHDPEESGGLLCKTGLMGRRGSSCDPSVHRKQGRPVSAWPLLPLGSLAHCCTCQNLRENVMFLRITLESGLPQINCVARARYLDLSGPQIPFLQNEAFPGQIGCG